MGYIAAALAFMLPGGIGAREAGLAAVLSVALPLGVAFAVAVALRLLQLTIELLRRRGHAGDRAPHPSALTCTACSSSAAGGMAGRMLAATLRDAVAVDRSRFEAGRDDPGALLDEASGCGWVVNAHRRDQAR